MLPQSLSEALLRDFKDWFTPKDLPKQEELREALEEAVTWAEETLGYPVRKRDVSLKLNPSDYPTILEHFPIRRFKIKGVEIEPYDCDERQGLLSVRLPQNMYELSYQVGYEPPIIPALIRNLVMQRALKVLRPERAEDETINALVESGKFLRAKVVKERNDYAETLRTSTSQRPY